MTQHIFWYPTKLGSGITDNNPGSPTKSVIDGKNNFLKKKVQTLYYPRALFALIISLS